ncbi:MAG TPA: PfkB family carbohydrate kinase [Gaiellaceae bacterium]|nr:PfkB family carbohydrate kinase [Gaiellaceae bacterium]
MLVCALGDLLLDVVVRLDGSVAAGDDTPSRIRVTAGGQAANVSAWAAALGAHARLIARRGDDGASRLAEEEVAARGVEVVGPRATSSGGVVVSMVDGDGERSMLTDRGASPGLRAEDVEDAWLDGCNVLHISGYVLFGEPMTGAAALAARLARGHAARVGVDLASARGIVDAGPGRFVALLDDLAPDVVFGGDRELAALGREPQVETLVVKHGERGVSVVTNGRREEYAALPAAVVDPTGAGDAFAAGFLVGGVELGLQAAARCVSTAGAMP